MSGHWAAGRGGDGGRKRRSEGDGGRGGTAEGPNGRAFLLCQPGMPLPATLCWRATRRSSGCSSSSTAAALPASAPQRRSDALDAPSTRRSCTTKHTAALGRCSARAKGQAVPSPAASAACSSGQPLRAVLPCCSGLMQQVARRP
jgi:hypothetical protein